MTTYRYLVADLLTNQILAELPLTGVSFTQQLNAFGTFSARILITDSSEEFLNISNATVPGRSAIYVDRDNVLVWGGLIWSRSYDSNSQSLTVNAQEFESYFARRRITTTQAFNSTDQFTIAQTLIRQAQAATNGNIGVQVGAETSGVTVSRTFYDYELKTVYAALQDLSKSSTGFDFRIKVAYDGGGTPVKTLEMGYPKLGTTYSASNISAPVFEFPAGNIVAYSYPQDGSQLANKVYAIGAGSNEAKKIGSAVDTTKFTTGWPLLEDSSNYTDITDLTLLGNLAAGQLAAVSNPPVAMTVIVPPYENPTLGSYGIGDEVRIRIKDDFFPNGLDTVYRIVALSVTPGEAGPERATLTLNLPT